MELSRANWLKRLLLFRGSFRQKWRKYFSLYGHSRQTRCFCALCDSFKCPAFWSTLFINNSNLDHNTALLSTWSMPQLYQPTQGTVLLFHQHPHQHLFSQINHPSTILHDNNSKEDRKTCRFYSFFIRENFLSCRININYLICRRCCFSFSVIKNVRHICFGRAMTSLCVCARVIFKFLIFASFLAAHENTLQEKKH